LSLSTVNAFKHMESAGNVVLDDDQLKALQKTLNMILADIVSVCEENHITYTLGGGSALGAVRHHGFIPWDDDIDINMPRRDYERFIPVFTRKFGWKYWIHTPQGTKGYNLLLSRIRLKGTSVVTREDFKNKEAGAFIDLFVMENTFNNALIRNLHGLGCCGLGFLVSCRKFYRDRNEMMKMAADAGQDKMAKIFRMKILIGFLISFISLDTLVRAGDNMNRICKNDHSKYITVPTGRKYFFGEMYLRKDVCRTRKVLYDGNLYRVPRNTDLYLKNLYGDYMKLPSPDQIEKHIFFKPFYLSLEEKRSSSDGR